MFGKKHRHHRTTTRTTPTPASRTRATHLAARMGHWSSTHWKTAVIAWFAFVIGALYLGGQIGTNQIDKNDASVGESHKADRIIKDAGFTLDARGQSVDEQSELVLVHSKTLTVKDPAFRAAIADVTKTLASFPKVTQLQTPPLTGEPSGDISRDGHSALIKYVPKGTYEEAVAYIGTIDAAVAKVDARHTSVTFDPVGVTTDKELDKVIQGGLGKAGLISIVLTVIILMFVLGSLVATTIPLLVGITSVLATFGLVAFASKGIAVDENIKEVVLLVGLAVGVDYSLFYMRREREERAAGRSETAALEAAAATSGHAVLVSGITVLIAMAGMFLSGDKTFMSFSVGTMIVVAVAMLGSLTVLPAVLGKLGDRVERGRIPFLQRKRKVAGESRFWGAIVDRVVKHPVISLVAAVAIMLTLAAPTLHLQTSQTGMDGISGSVMDPFKRLTKAFPGTPDPAVVAVKADNVKAPAVLEGIEALKAKAATIDTIKAPITVVTNRDGTVSKIEVPLAGNGTDSKSIAGLNALRDDVLPQTLGTVGGVEYAVTGGTANSEDFNAAQTDSVPRVFGFVLLFAFGLLLYSFRSIVIAVKAILLNLLSVAAAYGVLVAVFQWGWGESLLDFHANGGIANWLPMFMFVILFGLSMDYHVFILSRIREGYDRGLSTDQAISHGLKSTAGTVTSAALVMVGVFMVFTILPVVDLKEMGVGLAVAVLLDATLVRAVLLPSAMKLLGNANWYLPKWLSWIPRAKHGLPSGPADAEPALA